MASETNHLTSTFNMVLPLQNLMQSKICAISKCAFQISKLMKNNHAICMASETNHLTSTFNAK